MEPAVAGRGRDAGGGGGGGGQRRSPLDVIMSQIRRKRSSAADRKPPPGHFLSRSSEDGGESEQREQREQKEQREHGSGAAELEWDAGWGRVCVFLQRLGKKADSSSLSLAHCDLTATDLLELATLLHFLPRLEEVDVSWNELIGGCLEALTSHLHQVGGIRALRLCSCRLNTDDITALGEALGCVPFLEILDLSWNGGVGGGVGGLQGLLGKLPPPLREVHLVACRLTAADAAALGGALSTLPRLSVLDVSCNPQLSQEVDGGGGGVRELAASLSQAASLTALRLQACGLTPGDLHALGASLRCLAALRQLDLSCNKSLSGGLELLTLHLAHLTHLESLHLHLCCLTHTDLEALIQALPSLTALTELDVSSNEEAGGVVHPLVSALPLTQMKRLPLNSCSLTDESLAALALAVPFLRSVDVSWCKGVGGRLPLLLDALQPAVVVELRLVSCELTADDLRHLAVASGRGLLSSLRVLDLSYNGSAGAAGWSALFAAGGLGSLEDLDLSLRPSTSASCSAWLPALLGALPRLPALTRLAAQRWALGPRERRRLSHCLRKRDVLLQWDPDEGEEAAVAACESTNQESPEE